MKRIPCHDTQTKVLIAKIKYDTTGTKRCQTKVRVLPTRTETLKEKLAFGRYLGSHNFTTSIIAFSMGVKLGR